MANSLSCEKRLVKNQENLKHSTCFTGIPGLKIKSQKTISFEGSLPSFFLKSITLGKKRV